MPRDNFSITFEGLDDLKKSLDANTLNKKVALGVGEVTKQLHSAIASAVFTRYDTRGRKLDSVLIGNTPSNTIFGKNIIQNSLSYRYKAVQLSQFRYSPTEITNPDGHFQKHYVTVLRGQTKLVKGKYGRGGFVPRTSIRNGNKAYRYKGGTRMFERIGSARLPLRVMFGPSLSEMARTAWDLSEANKLNDGGKLKNVKDNAAETIAKFVTQDL